MRFPQQLAANFAELGRQLLFGVAKRHDLRFEGFRPRLRIRLERRQAASRSACAVSSRWASAVCAASSRCADAAARATRSFSTASSLIAALR